MRIKVHRKTFGIARLQIAKELRGWYEIPTNAQRWIFCFFVGYSVLIGCDRVPAMGRQPKAAGCSELDSLFDTLGELDSVLVNGENWESCIPFLQSSLVSLDHNQRSTNIDCNYLDQHYKPDETRLMFVETLRSRIEQDTVSEGIYYLLRLRGIFKKDPEISEFFSEEISYVAMENPACYLRYLLGNPDQEVMLLYSTKWNAMDLDTLLARFSSLPSSEPVVGFLKNLKDQKSDGI